MKFLALGDSYTIGEGVSREACWPVQLTETLKQSGFAFEKPTIVACTGWSTDDLLDAVTDSLAENHQYDLVSLQIGVNNQYRGYALSEFASAMDDLFEEAVSLATHNEKSVFALSIPDYSVTPFAQDKNPPEIAEEIEHFNGVIQRKAEKKGILFLDITPLSRQAGQDLTFLTKDQLHLSGAMYTQWIRLIKDDIVKLLKF
ncbi:SGNH/GDSL hydrolase family protein [Rapidithrix thailandica]|uniref:SGNH/GDSL hydrolase family protein n=1 Tax=Rapidithrix thailandica TaxID=413964 RepID=A0AAW9SET9_9BACT